MATPTTLDTYTALVGSEFLVQRGDGPSHQLTLTSAKPRIDDETQTAFALYFQGEGEILPQAIYRLRHAQLGDFDLFIVPIAKRRTGNTYEAVFNLLKDEAPL